MTTRQTASTKQKKIPSFFVQSGPQEEGIKKVLQAYSTLSI